MTTNAQMGLRLPDEVRRWLRREAAERDVVPGVVVSDLVRAEVDRRNEHEAGRASAEGGR